MTKALTEGPRQEQLNMAWQHLNSFAQGELERSTARLRAIEEKDGPDTADVEENNKTLSELRALVEDKSEGHHQ